MSTAGSMGAAGAAGAAVTADPTSAAGSIGAAGAALITHSLLARAQAALGTPDRLTLPRFLDLCGLFEAVVLLDRVAVLRSTDTIPDSGLGHALLAGGILDEFTIDASPAALSRAIARLPPSVSSRILPGLLRDSDAVDLADGRTTFSEFLAERRPELDRLVDEIDLVPTYPSIGGGDIRKRVYRSYAYLVAAGLNGWDYFPDYERAPFVAGFVQQIYRSLPVDLYEKVASSLQTGVQASELLSDCVLHNTLPIPPISSIVLHRSSHVDDIPTQLLKVRAEFAGYRRHFAELKAELYGAETVAARRKLLEKYRGLLGEVSGARPETVSLAEVLNLAEKAVPAAANAFLPTSYSALLVTQPTEWIRRWWRRRPLAILFRLDSKMPRLPEYRGLVAKLWGPRSAEYVMGEYDVAAAHAQRLMRGFDTG